MSRLFILCGHSFAGKSTLGRAMARRFGWEEIDVDVTKRDLYGPQVRDEELSRSDWDLIYARTDALLLELLRAGKTVVDASRNFSQVERQHARQIMSTLGVEVVTIYVDTPEAVVRQRLRENRRVLTRVDWPDDQFEALLQAMQPPGEEEAPLVFHYEDDMQTWMTEHLAPMLSPARSAAPPCS